MRNSLLSIMVIILTGLDCFAQHNIPVIKANSTKIAIKDGKQPITKYWDYLTTGINPIVYDVSKTNEKRRLTFYTDIDSISFNISPNEQYDFKVLLNSKDTCFAKISTVIPSYYKDCKQCIITNDTIPFVLGTDDYIHIKGTVNNAITLDFIFDTGAGCVLLTEKGIKKATVKLDGLTDNLGSTGFSIEKTSSSNHLQLSSLQWKNLPLEYIDYKGSLNADGIVGFNIFEDKVVEINYDSHLMIIHSKLPGNIIEYTASNLKHNINGSFIQASLNNGIKECTGWFLFDTGGGLTVAVGGDFSKANNLYGSMKKLAGSKTSGTGSNILSGEIDLLPQLKISGYIFPEVPVVLQSSEVNFFDNAGIIGMSVLKRFNTIIDYPNQTVYLKPNSMIKTSFNVKRHSTYLIIGISTLVLIIFGLWGYIKIKSKIHANN